MADSIYSLPADEYNGLVEAQGGRCIVCHSHPGYSKLSRKPHMLVPDTDSGSLVCVRCHYILHCGATPSLLRDIADYLEKRESNG